MSEPTPPQQTTKSAEPEATILEGELISHTDEQGQHWQRIDINAHFTSLPLGQKLRLYARLILFGAALSAILACLFLGALMMAGFILGAGVIAFVVFSLFGPKRPKKR